MEFGRDRGLATLMRYDMVLLVLIMVIVLGLAMLVSGEVQAGKTRDLHLGMEGGSGLNPLARMDDDNEAVIHIHAAYDDNVIGRSNRRQVPVGNWTSTPLQFPVNLSRDNKVNLFYRELDEGYNNDPEWEVRLWAGGSLLGSAKMVGPNDDSGAYVQVTIAVDPGQVVGLEAGTLLTLDLGYTGWEDVELAFNSSTHDSGVELEMDYVIYLNLTTRNKHRIELGIANVWKVDLDEVISRGFIQLELNSTNVELAVLSSRAGTIEQINGATVQTDILTWDMPFELENGDEVGISYGLTPSNAHNSSRYKFFKVLDDVEPVPHILGLDPDLAMVGEMVLARARAFEGENFTYRWEIAGVATYSTLDEIVYFQDIRVGSYNVTLRYEYFDGNFSPYAEAVQLHIQAPPNASAGEDLKVVKGTLVQFNGVGTDEDGSIVKWEWDFDADGVFEWSSIENGQATYIYNLEGLFKATLKVTDDDGHVATDSRMVTVSRAEAGGGDDLPGLGLGLTVLVLALSPNLRGRTRRPRG